MVESGSRAPGSPAVYDVEVRGLVHHYGRARVLDNVSLSICKGEFFSVLGPSGSGKTTMLRIIGGFVYATAGSVFIQNEAVEARPPYERNTTMVFQHLALFPHMTVYDNVAYGLKIRRLPREQIQPRVTDLLRLVQLDGYEKRYPKQLSGGQQQRVALARSLVLRPSVVLFDEPLGSLDLKLRREMQVELKNLQKRVGTTFVYVTHDQEEALTMSDRIAVMNAGRIEQVGSPEEVYETPQTRFVADFIGDTNLIEGRVLAVNGQEVLLQTRQLQFPAETRLRVSVGDEVALSVRPENVDLNVSPDAAGQANDGVVEDIIYTGSKRRALVRLDPHLTIKVDAPSSTSASLAVGQAVRVSWRSHKAYLLR